MTLRPPYPGDILLEPQRVVVSVDRDARTFRCDPMPGTPHEHVGEQNWPPKMPNAWSAAPIEPGWTELPVLVAPESSHTGD